MLQMAVKARLNGVSFLLSCLVAGCVMSPPQSDVAAAISLLSRARVAASEGRYDSLAALFSEPRYADSVRQIARDGAALRSLKIDAFPVPKGLEKFGDYWVIFHRYQGLEGEHDRIHPMIRTGDGLALGPEVPEDVAVPFVITHEDFKVVLKPENNSAEFETTIDLKATGGRGSVLMRMNDAYAISGATYNGEAIKAFVNQPLDKVHLSVGEPELVRSGGVVILTNPGNGGKLKLRYTGSIDIPGGDETTSDSMLLTSYWYPHIGRQPATSSATVTGPKDWLILTNGDVQSEQVSGDQKTVTFSNSVAIPYYHLVAGPYKMVAETKDRGRTFRAWHLDRNDDARGKADAESAKDSVAFFEDRYGKFPYNHYDVVDTPDYYGIECYSFTLLTPSITPWATSHEVGHTWFGGMVPNTYIKSIWNESLTQYIDSIVFKKNADRSLNNGYASRTAPVALADSLLAHGQYGNVGYYRGAYVMKMLENQIGDAEMTASLRRLVKERRGKKTEWTDIAAIFGQGWFFDQWVFGKQFPSLDITRAFTEPGPRGGFVTTVDIAQSGTPKPFRVKVAVVLTGSTGEKTQVVDLTKSAQTYYLESNMRPVRVTLDPFGYTLAAVPPPKRIGN